jgi:hypothetical protein
MQSGQSTVVRPGLVDVPNAARGASTGFSVLLIGGLLAPMVGLVSTLVATVWLTGVAVVAFGIAARRSRLAGAPAVHGAVAALFSYVLVLPLLLPFEQSRDPLQILLTAVTAVVVGAGCGSLVARRARTPRQT